WRELPPGWTGIPGMPLHFADSIAIPNAQSFSNLFQSIENSPTARGYEIAIAQFNGFLGYDCQNIKGVQKFRWNTASNEFNLEWTNDEVNMNGVLSYSAGSNLLYGTGKEEDCNYYYYGLDWGNGTVNLRLLLGPEGDFPDDPFYDQGVNHIVDEDGSIYFSGSRSLVKLERQIVNSTLANSPATAIAIYPNPSPGLFEVAGIPLSHFTPEIYSITGQKMQHWTFAANDTLDFSCLPDGVYFLVLANGERFFSAKVMKIGASSQ
ncbi:MAG: T9SS type A sorting domain-containing protein, partial [Bacteroidota bacterium]